MLDRLRQDALSSNEQQELLAVALMKTAAAELKCDRPSHSSLIQFIADQSWSKDETKQRLQHLVSQLNGYKDNRLRDCAIRIAQTISDES